MAAEIPDLSLAAFAARLEHVSSVPLVDATVAALHAHFVELRRWNRSLGLIGPGTITTLVERHYGESLAAVPWLASVAGGGEPLDLLDLGSGGGFPGFVLAAALPQLHVTLVDSRRRKVAFLRTAARRAGVACEAVHARIARPLPAGLPERVNYLTLRAVKLTPTVWLDVLPRLEEDGAVLLWGEPGDHDLPEQLTLERRVPLPSAAQRSIGVLRIAR